MMTVGEDPKACQSRKWLAGIHLKGNKDGCPMTDVGVDEKGVAFTCKTRPDFHAIYFSCSFALLAADTNFVLRLFAKASARFPYLSCLTPITDTPHPKACVHQAKSHESLM